MRKVAATVGSDVVTVDDVDAREQAVRGRGSEHALPRPGTSEARQMRRWLTQVLVAERIVALEAAGVATAGDEPPSERELLPDMVARMELGSVAAATLADVRGRRVYATVTAGVCVSDDDVADYHARNPERFSKSDGPLTAVTQHLLAAARRRAYRRWLDARCAELVTLADGYEHPGDPRQPDNTHRH